MNRLAFGLTKEIEKISLFHTPGNKLIFYDCETTGTDWSETEKDKLGRKARKKDPFTGRVIHDQITQLAARKYKIGEDSELILEDSMNKYFMLTPHCSLEQSISEKVEAKTSINLELLSHYPTWSEQAEEIESFFGDSVVVGHNVIKFDNSFVERMYKIAGTGRREFAPAASIDTLLMSRLVFQKMDSKQLENLINTLDLGYLISSDGKFHDAFFDVASTVVLYEALRKKYIPEFIRQEEYLPVPYIVTSWPRGHNHLDKAAGFRTKIGALTVDLLLKEYGYEWEIVPASTDSGATCPELWDINISKFEQNALEYYGVDTCKDIVKKCFSGEKPNKQRDAV